MTTKVIESEEVKTQEAVVVEIIPTVELIKINATDAGLAELLDTAKGLATKPVDSKEAYEEVHRVTMVAVKVRTGANQMAANLAAPFKEKADKIIAEGKRIGEKAREAENLVRPIKESYEAEQERLKKERAEAEAKRIAARFNMLYQIGATFDEVTFDVFGVLIDAIEVKTLPEDEWMDLYGSARKAWNTECERLDAIQKEKEAEEARLEQQRIEQENERIRLENERLAFEKQQAEQKAEQERRQREFEEQRLAFQRQQEEAEAARIAFERKKTLDTRVPELIELGFTARSDKGYESFFTFLSNEEISTIDAEEWEEFKVRFLEAKKQLEINAANMKAALKRDEEARIQAEKNQQKADKERQKRLAPEKKDFGMWLDLQNFSETLISIKQPEMIEFNKEFNQRMSEVVSEFKAKLEAL